MARRMMNDPLEGILKTPQEREQAPAPAPVNTLDLEFDADRERERLGIKLPEVKRGRPRKEGINRGGSADGLPEEWTRATFIIRVETLERLKDMAYTDRIKIKDALDQILTAYLDDRPDLLKHQ